MSRPKAGAPKGSTATETRIVAQEAAAAFGRLVLQYREHFGLTAEEARKRAYSPPGPEQEERLQNMPADQVSWHDIGNVAQSDPERAQEAWETVKAAALDELRTGHRAAKVMESAIPRCRDRAQFLAIRSDLIEEWQPRNGIERQLIDVMAQAQTTYLYWLSQLTVRATLESLDERRLQEEGCWKSPRITDAEALEQAAGMVDRFNRMFLRTLRALCDLRRYSTPVIVQNAGQVNIGEKQVNLAS